MELICPCFTLALLSISIFTSKSMQSVLLFAQKDIDARCILDEPKPLHLVLSIYF